MPRKKSKPKKPATAVYSLSLAEDTKQALDRLSQNATDYTGWKVSGSAVVRALLRYASAEGYEWGIANICPLIEQESSSGITWGRRK